jgi:translation elongation factor EF-Tu-like GTPase
MTALIAAGTTATTFAAGEFTVASGATASLMIVTAADGPIPQGVEFELARKGAGGQYISLVNLNAGNILQKGLISAAGTYAVRRLLTTVSAGMDKD